MKLYVALLCMSIMTGCSTLSNRDYAVRAAYAGAVTDAVSTKIALDRGCVEANPALGPNPSDGALVAQAALSAAVIYGLDVLLEQYNPDASWPFWTIAILKNGVAVHNLSLDCGGK